MQTVATMAERLDMSATEAVEKLNYMLFEVAGEDSAISDEQCDILIDVEDDPSTAEAIRQKRLDEREKVAKALEKKRAATQKAAAKRKSAAKKKTAASKPAAKKKATANKKAAATPKSTTKKVAKAKTKTKAKSARGTDGSAAATAGSSRQKGALGSAAVAEILSSTTLKAGEDTGKPVAEILSAVELKEFDRRESEKLEEAEGPAIPEIVIGSAIEHEEHTAEVVRADGTHVDAAEVVIPATEPLQEVADEGLGLLAEAELRQEREEGRRARQQADTVPKPDPEVVAEVIRRSKARPEPSKSGVSARAKQRVRAGGPGAPRKTGKTARKRQKKMEKLRAEESLRRDAAAAVREYESGGLESGAKRRRRRRTRETELDSVEVSEVPVTIQVEESMTVEQLATAMDLETADIILELMETGVMATKNQALTVDVIRNLAEPQGFDVVSVIAEEEELMKEEPDDPKDLQARAPVVTVMGHVDHGKTSLLDQVRKASVASGEAGGITQHIAAYEVELPQGRVVFLDTPGHEAFTAMRARGAQCTDVVVLVVAADDGVMPQTIEAIDHARAAEVPIVVAVNKCDKPNAQPDRIRQELTKYDLMDEQWGGKTIIKDLSALTGDGVDELMELLVLETELLELKANPNKRARGTIIESEITRGQGPVAWVLIQSGTLRVGDPFFAGHSHGRVRAIQNSAGNSIEEAGPSTPVVVVGFDSPPAAGDRFISVVEERAARAVAEKRRHLEKLKTGPVRRLVTLEDFHDQLLAGERSELNVLIKADVQGSVDVLETSIGKVGNEEVRTRVVHSGVGSINESDVLLASASDAVIVGFHVEASPKIENLAQSEGVNIRTYKIIYEAIEDIRLALEGLLKPESREVITGHTEIRQIFRSSALGNIAGSYQQDGEIFRDSFVRLFRESELIYEGRVASLRRESEDVRSVSSGFECGIKLDAFDTIEVGDVIESFRIEDVAKTLA